MRELILFLTMVFGATRESTVTMMVAGDVMPGRMVNVKLQQIQDFDYPFKNAVFNGADIVYINLESPIIEKCPIRTDGFNFCSDLRIVPALKRAGVTVANIANNHIYNEGKSGMEYTKKILKENNIQVTGYGEEAIVGDIGFLGFNDVGEVVQIPSLNSQILTLRSRVEHVVVQFHWGVEYTSKATNRQKELAYAAIHAGAELVVGNHPHWVQETEIYKGKLIAYSHGNFLFDQQWSKETQEGVIGKYVFGDRGLVRYEFLPIIIDKTYIPRWANEIEASRIKARMGIQ